MVYSHSIDEVCQLIRRDYYRKPLRRHYLGKRNGRKVYISEFALSHPYFDFSQGFDGIERPFRPRSPARKSGHHRSGPWYPKSLIGEVLYWLWCELWFVAAGGKS